jgi:preprotein translocase subunit SecA
MIDDVIGAYVAGATADGYAEDWDLDQLWNSLKQLYPVGVTIEDLEEEAGGARSSLDADFLTARLIEDAHAAYQRREEELGSEVMRQLERQVLLAVIDRKWREHLYEMDYLQEGISLRAYAQRDPVVEYQREGFDMFAQMMDGIKEETVGFLFNVEVQVEEPTPAPQPAQAAPAVPLPASEPQVEVRAKGLGAQRRRQALQYSSPTIDGAAGTGGSVQVERDEPAAAALGLGGPKAPAGRRPQPAQRRQPAPGQAVSAGAPSRNAPCPCGSGKKYKRCHGAPGAA